MHKIGPSKFFIVFFLCLECYAKPYFDPDSISPTLLDLPYENTSKILKKEIEQIIELQKNVKESEVRQALSERYLKADMVVAKVNPNLTRRNNPQLYHLLDRVEEVVYETNKKVKIYWNKKRPYIVDKRIKALIPSSGSPSYPSFHVCDSYVLAYILGMLLPEQREQFLKRAAEISQRRVLVGLHFPQDVEGGRQLALLIIGGLLQNDDFQKDLELAREELFKQ